MIVTAGAGNCESLKSLRYDVDLIVSPFDAIFPRIHWLVAMFYQTKMRRRQERLVDSKFFVDPRVRQ